MVKGERAEGRGNGKFVKFVKKNQINHITDKAGQGGAEGSIVSLSSL